MIPTEQDIQDDVRFGERIIACLIFFVVGLGLGWVVWSK